MTNQEIDEAAIEHVLGQEYSGLSDGAAVESFKAGAAYVMEQMKPELDMLIEHRDIARTHEKHWKSSCEQLSTQLVNTEARLHIALEGLEFYADKATYVSRSGKVGINPINYDMEPDQSYSNPYPFAAGKRAREVLGRVRG